MDSILSLIAQRWPELVVGLGGQAWLLLVLSILLMTLVIYFVSRVVLRKIHEKLVSKKRNTLDAFVDGARAPFSFFIWLSGTVFALSTFLLEFELGFELIPYLHSAKSSILILALGWYVIRVTNRLEEDLKIYARGTDKVDVITVEALVKVIKLTAFVITGLIILTAFNVNLTGLLAFGGMGGIAVGFAAKDLLGNVFGGLMLYLDKPFGVGDWIRSPDQEIEGTVERIGWRMTVVRTFDKRPLYIPNGTFAHISIENPSRMSHRRIKEIIGIRYDDMEKVKKITSHIRKMLRTHPDIASNQTIIVNLVAFAESSVNMMVYTFTKTTNWVAFHHVKEDVMLKIADIINKHDSEMAFPTQTLHIAPTEESVNSR